MYPNNNCTNCNDCPETIVPLPIEDLHNVCGTTYNINCIIYTGADIDCLGITSGMTFAEILTIFNAGVNTCECCKVVPVNCVLSPWSEWSECDCVTTEVGTECYKTRTRTVITPAANGGEPCGPLSETVCCPVDCEYEYEWGPCDPVTLQQTGTLLITTPRFCQGRPCPTATTVFRPCCLPVNCVVAWGPWSDCVGGTRTRTATVTTPASCGGTACPPLIQTESCGSPPFCFPVTNLLAEIVNDNVVISWTASTSTPSSYSIFLSEDGGTTYTEITQTGSPFIFPWVCNTTYEGYIVSNCSPSLVSSQVPFTITAPDCPNVYCDGNAINFISGNYNSYVTPGNAEVLTKINNTTFQPITTNPVLSGGISAYASTGSTNLPTIMGSDITPYGWFIGGSFGSVQDNVTTYSLTQGFVKLKCLTPTIGSNFSEVDNTYFALSPSNWGVSSSFGQAIIRVIKYDPVNDVIYIGGNFTKYRNVNCSRGLIRIIASTGAIDPTFNGLSTAGFLPPAGIDQIKGGVHDIQIDSNGKIVVAGAFSRVYFTSIVTPFLDAGHIIRLNYDGSPDTSFTTSALGVTGFPPKLSTNPSTDFSGVTSIAIANDGTDDIYAVGAFYQFQGQARKCIVKIKNDGSIAPNAEFNPGAGFTNAWYNPVITFGFPTVNFANDNIVLNKILIQGDCGAGNCKLIVGGNFGSYNGTVVNGLARMDVYGVLDPSFTKDTTPYIPNAQLQATTSTRRTVYDIKLTNTGNILIAGALTSYLGAANTNHYYVLSTNGALVYGANMTNPGLSPYGDYAYKISTYNI